MGKSYRIRTTPGADKNIVLQIDQDFEQLEILSLKIRQDDVYLRSCSDYGVIAGRVFANKGYGIPNAKVSIFIPVTDEDLRNPAISSIYPYKSLGEKNEDGYRYNLLPYLPSYSGHTPTGTFPSRLDNLINDTVVEIYDKYYKYTVQTNNSGDFLIYGVPVGTQTIVMNLDLSDMGQFSMDAQDLIRMGLGAESQFNGNKFNSSANLETLPQIIQLNKTIEVVPFWGEEDVCQVGITRTDFDITGEAGVEIKPTAVFMGSYFTLIDDVAIKKSCKAKQGTGNKCKMITGPGEIIAIAQTIYRDSDGLPILEKATLPNGGKLIDSDGTWLFDLPMNLDYVVTNEYGEQVLSNDPKIGVPTKGKYRFKIKWQQSKSISEEVKRGYYLVPNIKEKGWVNTVTDPLTGALGPANYTEAVESYAFDLNWSAYTSGPLNLTNSELLSYINCEDRFYEFDYNKVYTVSGFIDNIKRMPNRDRFLAIKRIEESTCDATVNKFPVNDGVFHTSIFWIVLNILMNIIGFLGYLIIPVYHILSGLIHLIWCLIVAVICAIMTVICFIFSVLKFLFTLKWDFKKCIPQICKEKSYIFGGFNLPMITYPDCETCSCENDTNVGQEVKMDNTQWGNQVSPSYFMYPFNSPDGYNSILANETNFNTFVSNAIPYTQKEDLVQILAGYTGSAANQGINATSGSLSTNDLPLGERINMFNLKGNYYNTFNGTNQIKVIIEPSVNPGKSHYDNTLTFITGFDGEDMKAGDLFTFVNPFSSTDKNITSAPLNSFGTRNLTGTTLTPSTVNISYADINAPFIGNVTTNYNTPGLAAALTSQLIYTYPSDVEYFQVITAVTVTQFMAFMSYPGTLTGSFADILNSTISITGGTSIITPKIVDAIDKDNTYVVICQRGVDPYSPKINTTFQLGKIFGFSSYSDVPVSGEYRLNIPVQNNTTATNEILFNHGAVTDNATQNNGFKLYNPSYVFIPDSTNYQSYNTILHSYYSSLDYNLVNGGTFTIYGNALNSSNTQLGISYSKEVNSSTANKYYDSVSPISSKKYTQNTQLQGGGYMYYNSPQSYYFSPAYPNTTTLTMSNATNIVMRSDRLPTSDSQTKNENNTYLLQQNNNTRVYSYGSQTSASPSTGATTFSTATPYYVDNVDTSSTNIYYNNVLNTFGCDYMVGLGCYQQNADNTLSVNLSLSGCLKDRVVKGCYKFCPECDCGGNFASCDISCIISPFLYIGKDLNVWGEFIYRFKFMFAICQEVLSEVFNNNWLNGTLFMYPFKISTYYNSLNQVSSRQYCTNAVMLHPTTNNFYYRSSPWDGTKFIGQQPTWSFTGQNGQNNVNIKYPTTVLNMGPKDAFLSEVILNGGYAGYNMIHLPDTSYQDTSEITNLFVLLRMLNENFLRALFSTNVNTRSNIQSLFSRSGRKVDADFAQTAAVNNQLGIIAFDEESYSTSGANPPVKSIGAGTGNIMMGIFFSATTDSIQYRDYISPARIVRWNTLTNSFAYDYLPVKSQLTPHYQWTIQNDGTPVFGSQKNNWATDSVDLVGLHYQAMDRLPITNAYGEFSPYPSYNSGTNQYNSRGYIYADNSTVFTATSYTTTASIYPNPSVAGGRNAIHGAPWYFYFGLIKGSSAMNKFTTKYIGEAILNE